MQVCDYASNAYVCGEAHAARMVVQIQKQIDGESMTPCWQRRVKRRKWNSLFGELCRKALPTYAQPRERSVCQSAAAQLFIGSSNKRSMRFSEDETLRSLNAIADRLSAKPANHEPFLPISSSDSPEQKEAAIGRLHAGLLDYLKIKPPCKQAPCLETKIFYKDVETVESFWFDRLCNVQNSLLSRPCVIPQAMKSHEVIRPEWMSRKTRLLSTRKEWVDGEEKVQQLLRLSVFNEQLSGPFFHIIPLWIGTSGANYDALSGTGCCEEQVTAFANVGTIRFQVEDQDIGVLDLIRSRRLIEWICHGGPQHRETDFYCCWDFVEYIEFGTQKKQLWEYPALQRGQLDNMMSVLEQGKLNDMMPTLEALPFFFPLLFVGRSGRASHACFYLGNGLILSKNGRHIIAEKIERSLELFSKIDSTSLQVAVVDCSLPGS